MYRCVVAVTMVLYVTVAFMNPGYVTSDVVKGNEYADDIENMKKYQDKTK